MKLKTGINMEELRGFGFAPGFELVKLSPEYARIFEGCAYELPWWHKFDGEANTPKMTEDGLPRAHAWVDTRGGENLLWFDIVPDCTYHAEMSDLDFVTDTVLALSQAGLIKAEAAEDKIFTHDEATLIVEQFENVLDAYGIKVPSPEDDEREPDNEAKLYGTVYSELLDEVEARVIDLLNRAKGNAAIVAYEYSGNM